MQFEHYRSDELQFDRSRTYQQVTSPYGKPVGFWLSVAGDDDWPSWCRAESFGCNRLKYRYDVEVDLSEVLVLKSGMAIDDFDEEYSRQSDLSIMMRAIDWEAVAQRYKGIIIAPYQWSRRMDIRTMWYYGWDCASGCIWDLSAIRSFSLSSHQPDEAIMAHEEIIPE